MRIVFVLEHYYPYLGGAEKLFRQLAEEFAQAGHTITVVTTRYQPELPKREKINAVTILRIDCGSRFLFTILSIPAVWKATKNADVVLTTTYNAAFPAWLVTRLRGLPTILIFHERWGKLWFKLPYLRMWQRLAFYSFEQLITRLPFEHYVAVSDATKASLQAAGISPHRIHRIYNGLDYSYYRRFRRKEVAPEFKLLYFGRLGVSKGLDLLLPAWATFVREKAQGLLQLVIPTYPTGLYQTVMREIEALAIPSQHLQLLHELERDELFSLVQQASAVVIPSYSEGFCFVAAETMAVGTPIISSGKGALAEVVGGRVIQMKQQNADALAAAIAAAHRGNWTDCPAKKFPLEQSVQAYIELLNRVGE
ncbi:MAG: glycosyltransferase family 4 protein [Bacteroidota bacterium]